MKKIVLIRYGQNLWNNGLIEARKAGKILKEHGFTFDIAYTSVLKRSIRT